MNDEQKREVDVLLALQTSAFQRYNSRQAFTWKISITFWTALALFLGVLVREGSDFPKVAPPLCALITLALIVVALHVYWIVGLSKRNQLDIKVALFWESKIQDQIQIEYGDEIKKDLKSCQEQSGSMKHWSSAFQIGITLILVGAIVYFANQRRLSIQPSGPANGSQPIRSETNGTSSAAGSPPGAERQFARAFYAPPSLPAAVAELGRYALTVN